MNIGETLYVTNRSKWRKWLKKNHIKNKEIWLIYYKKDSGKKRIDYNDAVEEALCFGWIDSIVKKIDEERYAQRFSPRKRTSVLSQPNFERLNKLIRQMKMTKAGLDAVSHVYDPKEKDKLFMSGDILKEFKKNKIAWENFQKFPKVYQRIRIAYLESRRIHGKEMFDKSLKYLIKNSEKNIKIGIVK